MKSEAQEISETVASWFHFKSLTGLRGLLKEASMAVPIAEYLAAKHEREVHAEKPHPCFKKAGKGRPKQLDFVREKRGDNTWHAAYETKFQTKNFDLIMYDLCRLLCLAQATETIGNPSRFLIYAAETEGDASILENKFNSGSGQRLSYFEGILPLKMVGDEIAFRINELHPKQRKAFRISSMDYQIALPSSIRVHLGGYYESGGFVCAVWQVWARRGSALIDHRKILK